MQQQTKFQSIDNGNINNSEYKMIGPEMTQTKSKPSKSEFNHLVGDGLRVKKTNNSDSLWIEGDGCRISLTTNSGLLRVTGDGCRIRIKRNLGSIEYTGDGGRILLGPESIDIEKVTYKGDGGIIECGDIKKIPKKSKDDNNYTTKMTTTKETNNIKTGKIFVTKVTTNTNDKQKSKTTDVKVYVRVKNHEITI